MLLRHRLTGRTSWVTVIEPGRLRPTQGNKENGDTRGKAALGEGFAARHWDRRRGRGRGAGLDRGRGAVWRAQPANHTENHDPGRRGDLPVPADYEVVERLCELEPQLWRQNNAGPSELQLRRER